MPDWHLLKPKSGRPIVAEVYVESDPISHTEDAATLTRAQIVGALAYLRPEFGYRIKQGGARAWEIAGPGLRKSMLSAELKALEGDEKIEPLSPFSGRVRELAESLGRPGERLPLVVGSFQRGAFRASVAYWLNAGQSARISSFDQLRPLVDGWNGTYPDPGEWQQLEQKAQQEALAVVEAREDLAVKRGCAAMERQLAAARLRVLRELGRYLVCVAGDTADLNRTLYEQMNRDIASAVRLKSCLDRLAGLPDWPAELIRELGEFLQQTTPNQRRARLLGSEIDAALEDPRWNAAMTPADQPTA